MKDRSELSKLYPTPKTYNELRADRQAIDVLRTRRLPKHIILTTSLQLYSISIALFLSIIAVVFVMRFSVISGVFVAFLVGLLWFGYTGWISRTVAESFQKLGANATMLLVVYVIGYVPLAAVAYKICTDHLPTATALAVFFFMATGIHFALVYVLSKLTLKLRT